MTRRETLFERNGELIMVEATVMGRHGKAKGAFILDTGAAVTTMIPELADAIGYSARDGIKRASVRTALGREEGYVLQVAELDILGFAMADFQVHVFDLDHGDIDGLLGMNFLNAFNYEIQSEEQKILIQKLRQ